MYQNYTLIWGAGSSKEGHFPIIIILQTKLQFLADTVMSLGEAVECETGRVWQTRKHKIKPEEFFLWNCCSGPV